MNFAGDIEMMWDQMWRASMPYGRKGIAVHALSAVDLALWDLLGKLRNEPVYALLGGKTKENVLFTIKSHVWPHFVSFLLTVWSYTFDAGSSLLHHREA